MCKYCCIKCKTVCHYGYKCIALTKGDKICIKKRKKNIIILHHYFVLILLKHVINN